MSYLINNLDLVGQLFLQHLQLTLAVLFFSLITGVPLGLGLARVKWLRGPVLGLLGIIYTTSQPVFLCAVNPDIWSGHHPGNHRPYCLCPASTGEKLAGRADHD